MPYSFCSLYCCCCCHRCRCRRQFRALFYFVCLFVCLFSWFSFTITWHGLMYECACKRIQRVIAYVFLTQLHHWKCEYRLALAISHLLLWCFFTPHFGFICSSHFVNQSLLCASFRHTHTNTRYKLSYSFTHSLSQTSIRVLYVYVCVSVLLFDSVFFAKSIVYIWLLVLK